MIDLNTLPDGYIERHTEQYYGLLDRLRDRKRDIVPVEGFEPGLFVALSGGVDSVTALKFACNYADNRGLRREQVHAVICTRDNSDLYEGEKRDLHYARKIAKEFAVNAKEVKVSPILRASYVTVSGSEIPILEDERICLARGFATYVLEAKLGAVSIDTTNFSENLSGQWTPGAYDGQIRLIADLFKTEVYSFARAIGVPENIIKRPKVSSELREGAVFTNYERLDPVLFNWLVGKNREEIAEALNEDLKYVERVISRVETFVGRWWEVSHDDQLDVKLWYDKLLREDELVQELHKWRVQKWLI